MFKTVVLDGSETSISELGGQNTAVQNLGSSAIYASAKSGITPDADGVCAIPAGGSAVIPDTRGTVYLFGTGKVQLNGTDMGYPNFKVPSSGGNADGGINSGNVYFIAQTILDDFLFVDFKEVG